MRAKNEALAARAIDADRTRIDMNRLMGSAPESCVRGARGSECLWRPLGLAGHAREDVLRGFLGA